MNQDQGETQLDRCPICNSGIKHWGSKTVDGRAYQIDICTICGYGFVNPRPSLDFLKMFYSRSGHHTSLDHSIRATYEDVINAETQYPNSTVDAGRIMQAIQSMSHRGVINTGSRFMDVGCGYGFFSKAALDSGFQVTSLEMAEQERAIARAMTGQEILNSAFEDLQFPNQSFDVILMSQILEHVQDIHVWINKAKHMLAERGMLVVALPNFGSIFRRVMQVNEPYIIPPAHLNYFNRKNLTMLLNQYDFTVVKAEFITRLPDASLRKRLPRMLHAALPVVKGMLSVIDAMKLGSVLNLYAVKRV